MDTAASDDILPKIGNCGIPIPNNLGGFVGQWNFWHDIIVSECPCASTDDSGHPNNGFGTGGGDGTPGNSGGQGANGNSGGINDQNR